MPMLEIFSGQGMEEMGINLKDMLSNVMPSRTKRRRVQVAEARRLLTQEEAQKLVDMDEVVAPGHPARRGLRHHLPRRARQDRRPRGRPRPRRVARGRAARPAADRRGHHGDHQVRPGQTDHVLFIAAGAFHVAKPSDLIPELQGRFPIRVELEPLTREDFVRILTEPENALIRQYVALLRPSG